MMQGDAGMEINDQTAIGRLVLSYARRFSRDCLVVLLHFRPMHHLVFPHCRCVKYST